MSQKILQDRNHITILIDKEKSFPSVQHDSVIKVMKTVDTSGLYIQMMKTIYYKTVSNIALNGDALRMFFLSRNKTRIVTHPSPYSI